MYAREFKLNKYGDGAGDGGGVDDACARARTQVQASERSTVRSMQPAATFAGCGRHRADRDGRSDGGTGTSRAHGAKSKQFNIEIICLAMDLRRIGARMSGSRGSAAVAWGTRTHARRHAVAARTSLYMHIL